MENQNKLKRERNIKKIITIIIIVVIVMTAIIFFSLYIAKEEFREWIDINVLRKEIETEDVASIDLDTDKNNQIFCYYKYIGILNEKTFQLYNQYGVNISSVDVEINTAIYATCEKYIVLAEDGGQTICLILDQTYLWSQSVEGEILQVYVNENGYVAVVTTDTTYRSIITLYDYNGKQILKNYLSSTRVVDVSISKNNQYLAFAEMDTSGTLIQSNIKIISVEEAQTNSENAIIYTKQADVSKMILNIQYQDKGELVCVYDDSINIISNEEDTQIIEINDTITFISANLSNRIAYIQEETTGLFNYNSIINIRNTANEQVYTYNLEEVAKEIYSYGDIIGINVGTEIYFVNTTGMLVKKYTSNQEITNVMLSNQIAIIIYKDKIEIINL